MGLIIQFQFVWDGTDHLGEESSIFTGIFADHYYAPRGFYFENTWASDQILTEANVEQRVCIRSISVHGFLLHQFIARLTCSLNLPRVMQTSLSTTVISC